MKTKTSKFLAITGIAIGGLLLYGRKKYTTALDVMHNISVGVKRVSNFRITFTNVKFDTVLTLTNTTNIDFGATLSSAITIKQIRVFNIEGEYLGKAVGDIYKISLPSKQKVDLPEVTFNLSLEHSVNEFLNYATNYLSKDFSRLNFKIDVKAFGNVITLEA